MTLGPPFQRDAAPIPFGIPDPATQAASVLAGAAASSLRAELWIQSDANGGIRVTLGTRFKSPTVPKRSEDRPRSIEGAA